MLRITSFSVSPLRPIDLDWRRCFERLSSVFDQFKLVAEGIEHVVDARRGAWTSVEDDWSIHYFAAVVCEIAFRGLQIVHLESDVVPPKIAVVGRLLVSIRWLIVLKQLKHQIWSDADHRNCQPRSSDVDMRFGPVSAISRARHFRRIERSEAVEFMTTEHLA